MALTILKKPVAKVTVTTQSESDLSVLIDRVGRQHAEAAKKLAKMKELAESLKEYNGDVKALNVMIDAIEKYGDDVSFTESGKEWAVDAGVRENTRKVTDLAAARKKLGEKVFMQIAKITLADLDKYIAKAEQASLKIVTEGRGTRKITFRKRDDK